MNSSGNQPPPGQPALATATAPIASSSKRMFNRRSFGNLDVSSPLLQLYCTLVAIELALKDDSGTRGVGHRVIEQAKAYKDRDVELAANGLENTLKQLICTNKYGQRANVVTASYPDIRYLRHDSDFPGDTTQSDLEAARDAARTLRQALDRYWKNQSKPGVVS